MIRRIRTADLEAIALRSAVEQDVVELVTRIARSCTAIAAISDSDLHAVRQFMGWHRLRFGAAPEAVKLPQKLAQFVDECGRQAHTSAGIEPREALDERLLAAGMRREVGVLSVGTLRRRVASVARVYRAAGVTSLQDDSTVGAAIAALDAANRREARAGASVTSHAVQRALLSTCDNSLAGQRDRAFLACWFAMRSSLTFLLRADLTSIEAEIQSCSDPQARQRALEALARWAATSMQPSGALFRRVRPDGRLGGVMSRSTAQQMISRRSTLAGVNLREPAERLPRATGQRIGSERSGSGQTELALHGRCKSGAT